MRKLISKKRLVDGRPKESPMTLQHAAHSPMADWDSLQGVSLWDVFKLTPLPFWVVAIHNSIGAKSMSAPREF
jgi:hypothetical protein